MSSTRRVQAGQPRRQNGWASAPEYHVLHGLNGTAVAFKAALQDTQEKRELLYFLQALSLRDGGLRRLARELVEMFPDRIGTPTMHAIGCQPGKRLTAEQSMEIAGELGDNEWSTAEFLREFAGEPNEARGARLVRPASAWLDECRERTATELDRFIEALCCDPKMEVATQVGSLPAYRRCVEIVLDDVRDQLDGDWKLGRERPDLKSAVGDRNQFRAAEVPYFHDVLGALFEYQRRHAEVTRADYVETSIGKIVFEAMDYVLDTGRSALVEGNSGFGKTTALKAWCEMHPGQARYVQLSGITTRRTFFRKLSKAFGVANGDGMSASRMQSRVEDFLHRTKLILAIDEGQYLWPQGKRVESHPELINWLNTACYNEGVPFLISATKQFTLRRQLVERSTEWSSEQSRRRIRKVFPLPEVPTTNDLQVVARKLLGDLGEISEQAVDLVVGYARATRGYFQTVTDAIEDAQLIAKRAGRDRITSKDLKIAIHEWRAPSDAALVRVFDSEPLKKPRGRRVSVAKPSDFDEGESPVNELLNRHTRPLQPAGLGDAPGRRETQPAGVPALAG